MILHIFMYNVMSDFSGSRRVSEGRVNLRKEYDSNANKMILQHNFSNAKSFGCMRRIHNDESVMDAKCIKGCLCMIKEMYFISLSL